MQKQTPRPDLFAAAQHMRELGGSWYDCMGVTGLSVHTLRCELEPGYRETRLAKERARPKPAPKPRQERVKVVKAPLEPILTASQLSPPAPKPPQSVLFEREQSLLAPRSLTAALCGDPPAGRSALDKRGA